MKRVLSKEEKGARRWERRKAASLPDFETVEAKLQQLSSETRPSLSDYACRILSQHGEDGVVHEILRRVAPLNRTSVEIGCGWNGGNSGVLAMRGYRSLMVDGNPELTEIAERLFERLDVTVINAWITPESVNAMLAERGFSGDIAYFGVDLDGVDYWILEGLTAVRPGLIVAEYNQLWGGEVAATIPYARDFSRNERVEDGGRRWPKGYYGVSLAGLVAFGRRAGYRLVASLDGNAFLLRDDLCPELPTLSAAEGWQEKMKGSAPEIGGRIREEGVMEYYARRGCPLVDIS